MEVGVENRCAVHFGKLFLCERTPEELSTVLLCAQASMRLGNDGSLAVKIIK